MKKEQKSSISPLTIRQIKPQYKTLGLLVGMSLLASNGIAAAMPEQPSTSPTPQSSWIHLAAAASEGGEGGEGSIANVDHRVQFLTNLGLVEGHLLAAMTLRKQNLKDLSITHAKHPDSELYRYLDFSANNVPEFSEELSNFSEGLSGDLSLDEIENRHRILSARVEDIYKTMPNDPALWAQAIHQLARTAAEEYRIGVVDGKINNLQEYQDSWGFVRIADNFNQQLLDSPKKETREIGQEIQQHLKTLMLAQPTVMPAPDKSLAEVSLFYSTVAMIELATLSLKN